ncbi:MAG: hypothetical protein MUC59_18950, partial [Saprospiraceae bacterium]|nr:hypothetical protein [Saprospiraceae bacterium]
MKKSIYLLSPLLFLLACNNEQKPADTAVESPANAVAADESITLPSGFKAVVFAESLGEGGRHIAVNSNGDVYVQMHTLHNGKGIAALRDTNGDGRADETEYFGSTAGTGIEIQGNHLYCSSDEAVFRYDLKAGALVPDESTRVMLIGGFPKQNEHAAKSFTLDQNGGIYVNIGAPSNCCQVDNRTPGSPGQDPCPLLDNHAGIWKFDVNKIAQQAKDGKRYVSGIRNAVA